jgi:hypothetical protein
MLQMQVQAACGALRYQLYFNMPCNMFGTARAVGRCAPAMSHGCQCRLVSHGCQCHVRTTGFLLVSYLPLLLLLLFVISACCSLNAAYPLILCGSLLLYTQIQGLPRNRVQQLQLHSPEARLDCTAITQLLTALLVAATTAIAFGASTSITGEFCCV